MILEAIAEAIPHRPECPASVGEHRFCSCGATSRRNVLYVRVQAHVHTITRGRVYLRDQQS